MFALTVAGQPVNEVVVMTTSEYEGFIKVIATFYPLSMVFLQG